MWDDYEVENSGIVINILWWCPKSRKTTAIGLIVVRASLGIMGVQLRIPWNPPNITELSLCRYSPIMPRDTSLSDSKCEFLSIWMVPHNTSNHRRVSIWPQPSLQKDASLGIMGDQLKAPLKPLNIIVFWWPDRFQRVSSIGHISLPKDASLSDSFSWSV